jgi:hypothetical protein
MNTDLKVLIDLIFAAIALGKDIAAKDSFISLLPDAYHLMEAAKPTASSMNSAGLQELEKEVSALVNAANEQDLMAYVESKIGSSESAKTQAVMQAAMGVVQAAMSLRSALIS